MTITAIMVGMISIIAQIVLRSLWFGSGNNNKKGGAIIMVIAIVLAILAPIATQLVSLAISRKREFTADATAVKFTRYSPGLRSALQKIRTEHLSPEEKGKYPSALAPLFISDPYKRKFQNLFATHPDINKRIDVLSKM
jgi:heat shock protein HtpX